MRKQIAWVASLAFIPCLLGVSEETQPVVSQPTKSMILKEGVTGGIIPPRWRRTVRITKAREGALVLSLTPRDSKEGQGPHPKEGLVVQKWGIIPEREFQKLLEKVEPVWSLPDERGLGEYMDVYELDATVTLISEMRIWQNSVHKTCVAQEPSVTPTVEQKSQFSGAVEAIRSAAELYCVESGETILADGI